jgi:hypothetical protein
VNTGSVFSKTGKGLLELRYQTRLGQDEYRLLRLINGKTNVAALNEHKLMDDFALISLLTALNDGGYIVEVARHVTAQDAIGAGISLERSEEHEQDGSDTGPDPTQGDYSA